jgi:hypothetical protein
MGKKDGDLPGEVPSPGGSKGEYNGNHARAAAGCC